MDEPGRHDRRGRRCRLRLGYREWIVTSQVQSMYSGANNGFVIRDSVENGVGIEQGFHSREKERTTRPGWSSRSAKGLTTVSYGRSLA